MVLLSDQIIERILSCENFNELDIFVEELGDKFQYREFELSDIIKITQFLISYVLQVNDGTVRESLLNTINHSLNNSEVGKLLDFSVLVNNFEKFKTNEKVYIVGFLGYSEEREYVLYLESLSHNQESLQEAIEEALTELRYRLQK